MPVAIFRADASTRMGIGHIMRCHTIAEMLIPEGWRCKLACSEETVRLLSAQSPLFANPQIIPETLPEIQASYLPEHMDLLVVDHYLLDAQFEQAARPRTAVLMVHDDLADRRHECDILLDQTFGREAAEYESLVPTDCTLLTGSQHALLRPQFSATRSAAMARKERRMGKPFGGRLFLCLGSGDPDNTTSLVMDALRNVSAVTHIDVVMHGEAPHLETVRRLGTELPQQVTVHTNVSDIAMLMARADLAIGAGGTSTWERCTLGLPTLLVTIADNQQANAKALESAGAALCLGDASSLTSAQIEQTVQDVVHDPQLLSSISKNAATLCDGRGMERVLHTIMRSVSAYA